MSAASLYSCHARHLAPGDIARGVNHSRIITGPPVRVVWARPIVGDRVRVRYLIIGLGTYGTRTVAADRVVTVQRAGES